MTHNIPTLARLERLPLRSVWAHEAGSFTPWLAQAENLQFLADAVGLPSLELIQTERAVSEFSCDIVAKVAGTEDIIVAIENQIEVSDHKHLGQTLTYLAGTDAAVGIWVAERFTEGHRAALDWLNRKTTEDVAFFGVEVEAWRIGDSLPAPRFNVVVRPNAWARETRAIARQAAPASVGEWSAYWAAFDPIALSRGVHRTGSLPKGTNYYCSLGAKSVSVVAYLLQSRGRYGAYIGMWRTDVDAIMAQVEADRPALEAALGAPFELDRHGDQTLWVVFAWRDVNASDRADWPAQHEWLADAMARGRAVFEPWLAERGLAEMP